MTKPIELLPDVELRQYEETLFELETRMPRRALLLDRIDVALQWAVRTNRPVALIVLSDFAPPPGDLREVARRLQSQLRSGDTVAPASDAALVIVCREMDSGDAGALVRRLVDKAGVACRVQVTLSGHMRDPEVFLTRALKHLA